jgi:mxaJ protein
MAMLLAEEAALTSRAVTLHRATGRARVLWAMAAAMFMAFVLCAGSLLAAGPAYASVLRVCSDPDNMPFSNGKGEGFENKLAELIAERLGDELEYTWFKETTGYVPNTVGRDACDLVMGYAQGTGLIEDTNPYYYTSYVLIYRKDDPELAGVDRLSDPRLKQKKIGLLARTPPASILAMLGLGPNAKPFETYAGESASTAAEEMIAEIASGKLDAGILWGPVGGYTAQRSPVPLELVPLVKENAGPSTIYGITMGVRPDDPQWKHQINKVLAENQHDINVILQGYDVPLLDQEGNLIAGTAER